jgi:homoserine kinase
MSDRSPRGVTAFAPGGVGNVGPGLDILGMAVEGPGDTVRAAWSETPGIQVSEPGHPDLPTDPTRHAAAVATAAVLRRIETGTQVQRGITLTVHKGLPLAGGQGGSAASAVAAAVAVNQLLGRPLEPIELMSAALDAEEQVAGRHADNVAASLLGGIVLIRSLQPVDLIQLPVPDDLWVVLVRPDQQLRTAEARSVLPSEVPRALALHQAAQVGALVAALASGDYDLLGRSIDDRIAEPARADLLPGFREAKRAALDAGALGSSISGAGPTSFALVRGPELGGRVAAAMSQAYAACGYPSDSRVARVDRVGARLIGEVSP